MPDFKPIETSRLLLVPATEEDLLLLTEGEAEFEKVKNLSVAPGYLEFPEALPFTLEKARTSPEPERRWWAAHLFIHREDRALMGLGGYKGPPQDGVVEIGYGTSPAYRGQGFATEAAQALRDWAFTQPQVTGVCAHTLAQPNASTRVLEKAGFTRTAEIEDPDDGALWRWEVNRE